MIIWSFALSFLGVFGLMIVGKKMKIGWLVALSNEVLWLAYTIITSQWGFLIGISVYSYVYLTNYMKWRDDDVCATGTVTGGGR